MSKSKNPKPDQVDPFLISLQKFRVIIQSAQNHSALIKKKTGISGAQLWLLQEVADAPGSRVGEIAFKMSLKSVTVSNLLDPLLSSELLRREQDEKDRRIVRLELTPKGKRLLSKAPRPTRGILPHTLQNLDSKSLKSVDLALGILLEGLASTRSKFALQPLPFNL